MISQFDLGEARQYLFKLLGDDGNPPLPPDRDLRNALQTAFIVSYVRPFSSNETSPDVLADIPARFVRGLTYGQRALHEEVVKLRNEEFAHSDPTSADVSVYVSATPAGLPSATPVSNVTGALFTEQKLRELDKLCECFYAFILDEMQQFQGQFVPGERF